MENASLVRSIIANQLCIEEDGITEESKILDDLGADSLDAVEMLMQLEEITGIPVPDEDIMRLRTVGEVIAYLNEVGK